MSKKGTIKLSEQRKLHSKSGNRCAICKTVLVDVENIDSACIGVNAHIYGEKPGAARYDATKPIEYVNSEANLIFLCCNCHTKIDGQEKEYPPKLLFEIKQQHEREVINEQSSFPKKKIYSTIENSLSREVVPFKDFQKGKTHLYFHKELKKSLFAACVEKRRVVLLGEAGCGKSVELKQLAAEVSADEKNNLYPILYDLKLYTSQEIEEIIRSEYSGIPMDKVFLILDAYDEIEEEEQIRFARKLNSFVKKHPNTFIVISSRNNFYTTADKDGYGAKFENFEEYSLCCLSAKQIEDYVVECKASWDLFCKEVNKHHINDLIENPFYLIEIVKLLIEDGELPKKSELMEKIILSRFSKDIKKYINTKDIYACKRDIMLNLQKVAFAMQCMHRVQISEDNYQHLLSREDRNYLSYSGIFSICENETHQFEHNNFREFLTAKYVSCLELEKIKQLLLTNDGKIKESWANVLSYLVIIYDNEEFLPWLCEIGPEYIVKFERTRISIDYRNRILIEFIDSISSRNIWLSRTNISAEDLAKFGESDTTCDYLLKQIENPTNFRALSNAIQVLSNFKEKYNMEERIREVLFSCIKSVEIRDYEKREAIDAIVDLDLVNSEITGYVLNLYEKGCSSILLYGIVNYLIFLPDSEQYIDILLKEYIDSAKMNRDYSTNIRLRIKFYLERLNDYDSICKVINAFSDYEEHYSCDKDVFESIIKNAIKLYKAGMYDIFTVVYKAIINSERKYNSEFRRYCKMFFEKTDTLKNAFLLLAESYSEDNWDILFLLEFLGNEECYESLLNDIEKHIALISRLYIRLPEESLVLKEYETALTNTKKEIPKRRAYIDYSAEHLKGVQMYFDSLFDKEDYLGLVDSLLEFAADPDITFNDLNGLINKREFDERYKGELLFSLVIDLKRTKLSNEKISEFLSYVTWNDFSVCCIYNILKSNEKIKVSEEQKQFIEKLCKENIDVFEKNKGSYQTYPYMIIYVMFFSSYFDFTYSKDIYLDMLFVPKYLSADYGTSSNADFSSYVKKHLTDKEIKSWIQANGKPGMLNEDVAEDCITYCQKNKMNCAKELAEDFCSKTEESEWIRRKSVEYIVDVFGYEYVYDKYLDNCDETLLKCIIDSTINFSDARLTKKLEEVNDKSEDPHNHLSSLIFLQSSYGLKKYYELAKERMTLPDFTDSNSISTMTERISEISKVELLPILGDLQDLLFTPGFVDKDTFGLWNSLHNAFRKMSHDNYDEVKEHLESSLAKSKICENEKCFCNSILIEIAHDKNTSDDVAWKIEEVISFCKSI